MAGQKSLAELVRFRPESPILGNMDQLLRQLDIKFGVLEKIGEQEQAVLDTIISIALVRMNEVFTPLIEAAEARLNQFGSAFGAMSDSELEVDTGPMILILTEETREAWVVADYIGLTATDMSGATLLAQVTDYDREIGQLFIDVVATGGAGTHEGWAIRISAAPDLAHAGRTDNPHSVTAAQTGAYTTAQVDAAIAAISPAIVAYINGLGFMRQSLNLSDLVDKAAARAQLNAQVNLGYTPVNKAGDAMTGTLSAPHLSSTNGTVSVSVDGTKYFQWSGSFYNTSLGRVMHREENLAGLNNPATARSNLGLGSAATVNTSAFMAAGTGQPIAPGGFRAAYAVNAGVIGTTCVAVDSSCGPEPGHHVQVYWSGTEFRARVQEGIFDIPIKSFVIQHPSPGKEDNLLVHACAEAPEAVTFYRGKAEVEDSGFAVIRLPRYVRDLCDLASATISLTRIVGKDHQAHSLVHVLWASEVEEDGSFRVFGEPRARFHWRVEATRKDAPQFEVEPRKDQVTVKGDGPYRYIARTK